MMAATDITRTWIPERLAELEPARRKERSLRDLVGSLPTDQQVATDCMRIGRDPKKC